MDLKPIVSKIAADCDLRNRFLRQFPKLFDSYFLSGGRLMTEDEINKKYAFSYFWDGMDFIANQVTRV